MIVKIKPHELACHEFSKKYRTWDHLCVCNDSFLEGFRTGKKLVLNELENLIDKEVFSFLLSVVEQTLNKTTNIEFKDGSHQLTFKNDKRQTS